MDGYDVIVLGGGIAGVSVAYELAVDRSVCLLEMEATLAFHTTGRSAAMYLETYGNLPIRALTGASRDFLLDPPDGFDTALVRPLPLLYVAPTGRADALRALHADVSALTPEAELIGPEDALRHNPLLRPEWLELAMVEPGALEVDVHALHSGYARGLRRRGGTIITSARPVSVRREGGAWTLVDAADREYRARTVVNAAGAWCDEVAALFGADPVGLRPLRRTLFTVPGPARPLPLTVEVDDMFYFRPEGDQYLCSPADETPQPPGDAKPDELEIARAIEAINQATTLDIRHVRSAWAGLRSFVADRTPVVGYDHRVDGLFWYAGQGGYGIQTCPALARTAAALVDGRQIPSDIAVRGLAAAMLAVDRSALRAS
jgi:D-arginine dehydrogenase